MELTAGQFNPVAVASTLTPFKTMLLMPLTATIRPMPKTLLHAILVAQPPLPTDGGVDTTITGLPMNSKTLQDQTNKED
ncbi:hypothetical protein JHK87_020962 [Glycine soja]|nr:hypothetical protein JHK87_020962 [Glycine soja]